MKKKTFSFFPKTLKFKVHVALLLATLLPLLIYIVITSRSVTNNFYTLEQGDSLERVDQARIIIKSKELELGKIAKDYAIWDEAYKKIEENDAGWVYDNITGWVPDNFNIDLIMVINNRKELVGEFGIKQGSEKELLNSIPYNKLLRGDYNKKNSEMPAGIVSYQGELYLMAVCPVLESYYKGDVHGLLLLGKKINGEFLAEIHKQFDYNIFMDYSGRIISTPDREERNVTFRSLFNSSNKLDYQTMGIYSIGRGNLLDISGKKIAQLYVIERRALFISTLSLIKRNAYLVLIFLLFSIPILTTILRKSIVGPIENLEKQISMMSENNVLSYVDISGPQEIQSLANRFNKMAFRQNSHQKERDKFRTISITDSLTGLYNHRFLYEYFDNLLDSGCEQMQLLFCDIDNFKTINDINGHLDGDLVLAELSKIINTVIKDKDAAFRYGGEEFAILLPDKNVNESYDIAEEIRKKVSASEVMQAYASYQMITVSIGIASYPEDAKNLKDLINMADMAMYYSKNNGKNQTKIYSLELAEFTEDISVDNLKHKDGMRRIHSLIDVINSKDTYIEHSNFVSKYSLLLAESLNMKDKDKQILKIGGLLHDCGKVCIPDNILKKPSPLTTEEEQIIKNHPILGSDIVKFVVNNGDIERCIRHHHERWDGKGYPEGLLGEEIPIYARIVSIADAYHAMISKKNYGNPLSAFEACKELEKFKETQFDPNLVDLFIKAIKRLEHTGESETNAI